MPLLLRGTGVSLTEPVGAAGRADVIAGELHMAAEELAALAQLRGGRVRLVAFPSAAATLVPQALRTCSATTTPAIEVGIDRGRAAGGRRRRAG